MMSKTMTNLHYANELYFCAQLNYDRLSGMLNEKHALPERAALVFSNNGGATFMVDERIVSLDSSQFMFLHPRQEVSTLHVDKGASICIIGFMPALQDVVSKQFGLSFFTYVHKHPVISVDSRTAQALRSFYDLYEYNYRVSPGPFSTEIANSLFSVFMQTFYQTLKERGTDIDADDNSTLTMRTLGARFLELLRENFKQQHSVSYYADELCVSSKYLAQVVKSLSQFTPKELIDRRLGEEALFLLTKTEMNIQEVSNELGFPDQSYFGRFFKRLFGMAPLHYRMNPDMSLLEKLSARTEK